jgi:FMN phosphatase YigB (HAD superfamily)
MPIKLILFDVDNTLVFGNNANKFYNQYYLALQKLVSSKMKISEKKARHIINMHIKNGFRSETILTKWGIDMALLYNALLKINPSDYLKPVPFITNLLEDLKDKRMILGILTDSPIFITNHILRAVGIEKKVFDFCIGWERGRKMPKAGSVRIFCDICKKYNLKPKEIIMIGDSLESDITPAKKVGLNTIFISNHKNYSEVLTISSIKILPNILKEYFQI